MKGTLPIPSTNINFLPPNRLSGKRSSAARDNSSPHQLEKKRRQKGGSASARLSRLSCAKRQYTMRAKPKLCDPW